MGIDYHKDPYERKAGGTVQDGGRWSYMLRSWGTCSPVFVDHGWSGVSLGSETSDLQR